MSRWFFHLLVGAALAVGVAGCGGGSSGITKSEYIQKCSDNAGPDHCECVWAWFERNVPSDERPVPDETRPGPPELVQADTACVRQADNDYVRACVDFGRTRSYCRCVWRWFVRNVSRERAGELRRRRLADPYFQSSETRRATRACS